MRHARAGDGPGGRGDGGRGPVECGARERGHGVLGLAAGGERADVEAEGCGGLTAGHGGG